jgi:hypothetical protein
MYVGMYVPTIMIAFSTFSRFKSLIV